MEKLVYSIQEVANLLGISRSYAYELARKEQSPSWNWETNGYSKGKIYRLGKWKRKIKLGSCYH